VDMSTMESRQNHQQPRGGAPENAEYGRIAIAGRRVLRTPDLPAMGGPLQDIPGGWPDPAARSPGWLAAGQIGSRQAATRASARRGAMRESLGIARPRGH
jgi:hypothetical protein